MAGRVLIVEDEKPLALALELTFRRHGYRTMVAHDGKAALKLMAQQAYDVALLDLMMPVMDGFEVLAAARKQSAAGKLLHVPVFIVLSNLTQPDDEARCLALGARKFLVKSETSLAAIVSIAKEVMTR